MEKQFFGYRVHFFKENQLELVLDIASKLKECTDLLIDLYVVVSCNSKQDQHLVQWRERLPEGILLIPCVENEMCKRYPYFLDCWYHTPAQYMECMLWLQAHRPVVRYQWFWFWEYDVRYTHDPSRFLLQQKTDTRDLLGRDARQYDTSNSEDEYFWWKGDKRPIKLPVPLEKRWKIFMPVCRLSKRLLEKMVATSDQHWSFAETHLSTMCAHWFGSDSLGDFSGEWVKHPYYTWQPVQQQIFDVLSKEPVNRLVHPIK